MYSLTSDVYVLPDIRCVCVSITPDLHMCPSHIFLQGTNGGGFPLRMELVETLCIADRLGILKTIDYICRRKHKSSKGAKGDPSLPQRVVGPQGSSVDLDDNLEDVGDPGMISEEEAEGRGHMTPPPAKVTPSHGAVDSNIAAQMAAAKIELGSTPARQGAGVLDVVSDDIASSPHSKYIGVVKRLPSPASAASPGQPLGRVPLGKVVLALYGMGAGHVV